MCVYMCVGLCVGVCVCVCVCVCECVCSRHTYTIQIILYDSVIVQMSPTNTKCGRHFRQSLYKPSSGVYNFLEGLAV